MAFASVGTLGTVAQTANNQTTIVLTTTAALEAGNLGVIIVAVDNNQTTDGDEGAISSMADSAGNTWNKAIEFCNGQGAAQAGTTVSIWYCVPTITLASGGTITGNYTNNASRDESCATAWEFTFSGSIAIEGTPAGLANDGADPGSLDVTTSNIACLRIRGAAGEVNNATEWTPTSGSWTVFTGERSANVATAQAVRGEWIISTGTGAASDPTWTTGDMASGYVAFKEVAAVGGPRQSIGRGIARGVLRGAR